MAGHNYFLSDLHMFSRRSRAAAYEAMIQATADRADRFVLGGDIFDFRWSTLGGVENTVEQSIRWLDNLVGSHARCEFHFVLGNHDFNRKFLTALDSYCLAAPNLHVHHYLLQLGHSVFLHGDVADKPGMSAEKLKSRREHWLHDETRSPLRHTLYDLAMKANLHRVAGKVVHPRWRVAARIYQYLNQVEAGPAAGTKQVYFGHTHEELANYHFGGLTFHNGGAPMSGQKFRIVEAEIEE
jgi:UDP-2,3-diacylglucosamine hydrolase